MKIKKEINKRDNRINNYPKPVEGPIVERDVSPHGKPTTFFTDDEAGSTPASREEMKKETGRGPFC